MSQKTNQTLGSKSHILVMGGLGFIGSHLSRLLVKNGHQVRIFDKLYATKRLVADILDDIEIVEGDIEKPSDVLHALQDVDAAIHLVHTTVPGSSMQDPGYDVQSNVSSCTRWLPLLADTGLKKIIYVSSGGTVYGVPKSIPIAEDHPTDPICSYGITKLAIEKYIAMYANLIGIDYRICRPSNVYGESQQLGIGQGVVGVFLDNVLREKPIYIWGDGTSQRDYLYVEDAVSGISSLLGYKGKYRVFNLSTNKGYTLKDILSFIEKQSGFLPNINYLQARGIDVPINILNNDLITKETGWKPEIDMEEGLKRVYNWQKNFVQG